MLPEEEAVKLDEQLFSSDEMLESFEAEEERLIEDFVRQELNPEEAWHFRAQCTRSPLLRKKVEELETLLAGLGRSRQESAETQRGRGWKRLMPRLMPVLAPALALGLCCVAVLYVHHQRRVSQNRAAGLSHASLADSQGGAAATPVTPRTPANGSTYVAFLPAEVVRGEGSVPHLTVPAGASDVTLQAEVRSSAGEDSLWIVTLLAKGRPVGRSTQAPLRVAGAEKFLELNLDAKVLVPGTYSLRFSPAADPQTVQVRPFVVDSSR